MGGTPVQAALLYGAGPLAARHNGTECGDDLLYAYLYRAYRCSGLCRGEGLWPAGRLGGEPLRHLPADARGGRLCCGVCPKDACPYAEWLGGGHLACDTLLVGYTRLWLGGGCLQQYLGGEIYA